VLESVSRGLKQHGFRDIVLIGDHGSDIAGQGGIAATLNAEWTNTNFRGHDEARHYEAKMGDYADVRETSQMLYIDAAMVHVERLEVGNGKNGVEGDPRHATAEIGRMLTERTIERTRDAIKNSIAAPDEVCKFFEKTRRRSRRVFHAAIEMKTDCARLGALWRTR
jgi:creatinine amidohydrolase